MTSRADPLWLRGQMVECFHPDSPGVRLTVWRPWWRRKRRVFATLGEVARTYRPTFDAIHEAAPPWCDSCDGPGHRGRCWSEWADA